MFGRFFLLLFTFFVIIVNDDSGICVYDVYKYEWAYGSKRNFGGVVLSFHLVEAESLLLLPCCFLQARGLSPPLTLP